MVQRGPRVGEARYLGVREFARLLGVSTATVYKAVGRGELAHVRVSSVIRILIGATGPGGHLQAGGAPAATRPAAGLRANLGSSRMGTP